MSWGDVRDVFSSVGAEVAGTVPHVKACALTTGYLHSRGARGVCRGLSVRISICITFGSESQPKQRHRTAVQHTAAVANKLHNKHVYSTEYSTEYCLASVAPG